MADDVLEFYQRNKQWVDELAVHSDTLIRAMALAVKKAAGEKVEEK